MKKIKDVFEFGTAMHKEIFAPSAARSAIEHVNKMSIAYEHRTKMIASQFFIDSNFKVTPIELKSPELDMISESIKYSQEVIMKAYGVPNEILSHQKAISYINNPNEKDHMMDSFRYAMEQSISNLHLRIMYGTWDIMEPDEEWIEEYKEGQEHKTIPL